MQRNGLIALGAWSVWVLVGTVACSSPRIGDLPDADASPDVAAMDAADGGGPTPDMACADYAKLKCDDAFACSRYAVDKAYPDVATCATREQAWCLANLAMPHTGWNATRVEACLAAIPHACSDIVTTPAPAALDIFQPVAVPAASACHVSGSLNNGDVCTDGAQCASGVCTDANFGVCGTCTPSVAVGQPCSGTLPCAPPSVCHSGTCQVIPTTYGGVLASCDGLRAQCAWGSACLSGECLAAASVGATCKDSSCSCGVVDPQGTPVWCKPTQPPPYAFPCVCTDDQLFQPAQPCTDPSVVGACAASGTCASTCVAAVADGAPCGAAPCMAHSGCFKGKCTPIDFVAPYQQCATLDGGTSPVTTLLSGLAGASPIVLDTTNMYLVDYAGGRVLACPLGGCGTTPTVLESGESNPTRVAVDATNVYFVARGSGDVKQCPKSGCGATPLVLATGQKIPNDIAVNATTVYWANADGVVSCAINGCGGTPTALITTTTATSLLAIDATHAYFTVQASSATQIDQCPLTGYCNSPTTLGAFAPALLNWLTIDAASFYVSNLPATVNGAIVSCPLSGCAGSPTIYSTNWQSSAVAVDTLDVYWTETTLGEIVTCPKSGCTGPPKIIASGQNHPRFVAVDATNVYWSDDSGSVKTTPK